MAVNLSPVGGVAAQFFTNNGVPLTGGKIFTYAAGTTTPAATYTTSLGNVAWTNPIVLDAAGRVPGSGEIWLFDGTIYKFILKDSNDVLIATYDNITGINSNFVNFTASQEIQTATAGQTVFNLTTMQYQPGTNSLTVYVDGVNQYGPGAQYAYLETDSDTVTFINGLHVGASVKFTTATQTTGNATDASVVAYTPPFTGSVSTNVEAKLAQYVSVQDFGAVGDGVTDDTAAIQAAISYAFSAKLSVYAPAGVYLISDTLTAPAYFSLFGDPHNYSSGDNDPAGERYGSVLVFAGSINDPVIYANMASVTAFALRNLSIRVSNTYNNVGIHLLGSSYTTQGGTFDCEIDNVAVIREGAIGPQVTNAVGIYFDATDAVAATGRAFFGSKVNNYYAFNLNTGLKLSVATNTAGTDNFINSNIFSNIKMYQTYIGIELTGATGANAIWRNTFSSIFIQGGLGTGGNPASSQVAATGAVADNVFVNTIVWDSPSDVFLSATHWKQNTNVQSFGYFSLDVIAQAGGVFGGGGRVAGGAYTQAKGVGAYNASTGQLAVYDINDERRRVNFGYDPTLEAGYIQAAKRGVANEPLLLNPNGGSTNLFPVNGAAPLLQNAMVFDYVSDTQIALRFKGSDNVVRFIAFTLTP